MAGQIQSSQLVLTKIPDWKLEFGISSGSSEVFFRSGVTNPAFKSTGKELVSRDLLLNEKLDFRLSSRSGLQYLSPANLINLDTTAMENQLKGGKSFTNSLGRMIVQMLDTRA